MAQLVSHSLRWFGVLWLVGTSALGVGCGSSDGTRAARDGDSNGDAGADDGVGQGGSKAARPDNPDRGGSDAQGGHDDGAAGVGVVASGGAAEIANGGADGDVAAPSPTGLRVEPAQLSLPVQFGHTANADLRAVLELSDETTELTADGTWSSGDEAIATVDAQGRVTATGARGGAVTIRFQHQGLEASASVHVQLSVVVLEGTVTTGDETKLDGGASVPTNAPTWEYPEDKTVFPARMQAPKLQWHTGGDPYFRLQISRGTDVSISVYTSKLDYQPTPEVWATLGNDFGQPVVLALDGKATLALEAERHSAPPRSISLADATLDGAIYSFQTTTGLGRLDLTNATQKPLFPQEQRCRSCHSPSRDGSLLAFEFDGGGNNPSGIYGTGDDASLVPYGSGPSWGFSTFSPDTRALVASSAGVLTQYDTSAPSAPKAVAALDLESAFGTQPTWSPDGSRLAFVTRPSMDSDWAFTSSSIRLATWDRDEKKFSKSTLLSAADAGDATRDTLTNPSWSPDSRYIAAGFGSGSYVPTSMTLALIDVVNKTRQTLSNAAGTSINETPSFAPRAQGGFYWLVFTSNRPFGHSTAKRQLWVTAVDATPGASVTDPSHPAFWLPGQTLQQESLLGQWAPSACSGRGTSCGKASDCCAGLSCLDDGKGGAWCGADQCSTLGQPCQNATDCCAGAGWGCRADLSGTLVCQP